jgi:hypothetical protein
MKTIKLNCLVFILILAGCAPVKMIDSIPRGSPKGYVEFFCINDKNYCSHKQNLSLIKRKGEYFFIGKVSSKNRKKDPYNTGYIIAQAPGPHYVSTLTDTYYFNIEEDMVTPIEIKLCVSASKIIQPWGYVDKNEIKAYLCSPGKLISIEEYDKNFERRKK